MSIRPEPAQCARPAGAAAAASAPSQQVGRGGLQGHLGSRGQRGFTVCFVLPKSQVYRSHNDAPPGPTSAPAAGLLPWRLRSAPTGSDFRRARLSRVEAAAGASWPSVEQRCVARPWCTRAQSGPGAPGISVCARSERGAELRLREELVMVRPGLPCHARVLCPVCPEGAALATRGALCPACPS